MKILDQLARCENKRREVARRENKRCEDAKHHQITQITQCLLSVNLGRNTLQELYTVDRGHVVVLPLIQKDYVTTPGTVRASLHPPNVFYTRWLCRREDDVDGRARVTKNEERVLRRG